MASYSRRPQLPKPSNMPESPRPLEDSEEDNPISSDKLLKKKSRDLSRETGPVYDHQNPGDTVHITQSSSSSSSLDCGTEYDRSGSHNLTIGSNIVDKDDQAIREDTWIYIPALVTSSKPSRVARSSSHRASFNSFISFRSETKGSSDSGSDRAQRHSKFPGSVSPTRSPMATHRASLEQQMETLQKSNDTLKNENAELKRKLAVMGNFADSQAEMVRQLEQKLESRIIQEEKTCHDLELQAQETQEKLAVMTERTETAEKEILKLKEDLRAREIELIYFQQENKVLHRSLGAAALKQDTILQNLDIVRHSMRASLEHLVFGADTLNLVVDILRSAHQISEIEVEDEENEFTIRMSPSSGGGAGKSI